MITQDIHPLDPRDAEVTARFRTAAAARKGRILGPEARPMFDAMRAATPCAVGTWIEPGEVGGVTGVWCRVGDGVRDRRLLFLHGGGYMLGSAAATANFASQLATRAGADTFVPDYRLAPEHPFPAAFLDALAAYQGLATGGGGSIALAGESAGGGLTLALLAAIGAEPSGKPPVAAAVMSPWTDLALTGASYRTRAAADPIFTRATLEALAETYLQGQDPNDPRASPLRGPMRAGPSLRIDVGADEVLLDDARTYPARGAGWYARDARHLGRHAARVPGPMCRTGRCAGILRRGRAIPGGAVRAPMTMATPPQQLVFGPRNGALGVPADG